MAFRFVAGAGSLCAAEQKHLVILVSSRVSTEALTTLEYTRVPSFRTLRTQALSQI